MEGRPLECSVEGKWRLHPILVREGDLPIEVKSPSPTGFLDPPFSANWDSPAGTSQPGTPDLQQNRDFAADFGTG